VRRRTPWLFLVADGLLFLVAFPLGIVNGSLGQDVLFTVLAICIMLAYSIVGAVIASRGAGGPIGWLFLAFGTGFLVSTATGEYAVYADRHPGALPLGLFAAWFNNWLFIPTVTTLIVAVALFPTGRVPSPRWRLLPPAVVALTLCGIAGTMLRVGELDVGSGVHLQNPTAVPRLAWLASTLDAVSGAGLIAAMLATIGGLALRYRRSRGDERQQIRWLAYVALAAGVFFVATFVLTTITHRPNGPVATVLFDLFFATIGLGVPIAAAVAILRYRLWDLDLVVQKAVIAAVLVVAIVGVSTLVLALVGSMFVGVNGPTVTVLVLGVAIGLAATALRRLAGRVADRVVYGGRATPYEVLTDFTGRVAETYSTDDVVPRMAAIVGSGAGASRVTIWLRVGHSLRPVAGWPEADVVTDEGASWFEVRHQGEPLGAITVSMPANDPMTPSKERLVHDLAAQAGLVLRNVRLIEELRESRRRIVSAQDERARALERNIHDGAQQQLVALAVKIRLADGLVERDPSKARELLVQIQADAQDALENLRDLARGIYPPLLADKGLVAALSAQAAKASIPVEVSAGDIGRYEQDIEAAVYFCALEALQNAAKYARASRVEVSLTAPDGSLTFRIADDGQGFDPGRVRRGVGLNGMTDRIEAIGGRLEISSAPGAGTTIEGIVPVRSGRAQPPAEPSPADESAAPVADSHAATSRSGPNTALGM
jgi:signal transduction histidine kinase